MKGLIFTYVLTYGGAIASLINPFYGLLIYICFSILMPPALWHWSVPVGNYSRVIGVAFLLGWAINGFGDRIFGAARSIVLALAGYFLWVVLSTVASPQPELGIPFIDFLAKIVLPFIAGVTLIRTPRQANQLMWVIVLSCAYLALETNMAYLGGLSIEQWGFRGLDNNTFAIFIVTGFGLALVLAFEDPVPWRRFACFLMAAAMAHVPMLAFSRGGMLGILIAAVATVVIIPKTKRTWQIIAASCIVGAMLAGPSVVKEFGTLFNERKQRDFSAQSRLDLWADCFDVATTHPFLGVGQGRWPTIAADYGWPKGKAAHSLWFQTAAELGFPGLIFLLLFYYRVLMASWRTSRLLEPSMAQTSLRAVIASLIGFAVSASFLSVDGFELPYYVALVGACLLKLASAGHYSFAHEDEFESLPADGDDFDSREAKGYFDAGVKTPRGPHVWQ